MAKQAIIDQMEFAAFLLAAGWRQIQNLNYYF